LPITQLPIPRHGRCINGVQSPASPGTRRSRDWLRSRNCPPRWSCRGIGAPTDSEEAVKLRIHEVAESTDRVNAQKTTKKPKPRSRYSPRFTLETQVMRQQESGLGGPLGPIELRKLVPFEPYAASDLL